MSEVAIVVPCYNEAERLDVNAFEAFITSHQHFHFYFIDDGSADGTARVLEEIANNHQRAHTIILPENAGKAEAVRAGILFAAESNLYSHIGFIDADLATPLEELLPFEQLMTSQPQYKLVLGSRWKRLGSQINRSTFRHYLGRIFATVVSLMFNLSVYDTQCGAKLMQAKDLHEIFREPFLSPWFFDIEIICRYKSKYPGLAIDRWAAEIPLQTWHEVGGSRIKAFDFFMAPLALWQIKRHYRV